MITVAFGVAIFVGLAMLQVLLGIPLKYILMASYGLVFLVARPLNLPLYRFRCCDYRTQINLCGFGLRRFCVKGEALPLDWVQ